VVVLSEAGRASHWLVPQFLLIVLARFTLTGRSAILMGVITAAMDFIIYRFDLVQYLPIQYRDLGMSSDWGAIAISFLFLLFIFYVADVVLRETLNTARITEGRYRSLFDNTNDAIFMIKPDLTYLEVNQNAAELLGYTREELVGKSVFDSVAQEDRETVGRYFTQLEKEGSLPFYERSLVRADGSRRQAEVSVTAVRDERGKTLFFQSVMRDITQRKVLEEQLRLSLGEMEALAMQDPLTGLLNRRAIMDHTEAEWHRAQRERRPVSVAVIDLDNLKEINDNLGHLVGDQVIEQLARTVKTTLRRYDWAGRWGGDEFMLVLPGTNLVDAQEISERLRNHYNSSELITGLKSELKPFLSIGIACYSGRPGEDITPSNLFNQADQALYRAKQAGKNRIEIFRTTALIN
jgi:diguanylate cyclase (GGDEF)-like protein/PAS domain S-box-containing protein